MFVTLASGALAALAFLQQIDTTVTAQQGQRLVVDSYGGEIAVKTWGRNAVRVEADPPSRTEVVVSSSSGAVSVRSAAISSEKGSPLRTCTDGISIGPRKSPSVGSTNGASVSMPQA